MKLTDLYRSLSLGGRAELGCQLCRFQPHSQHEARRGVGSHLVAKYSAVGPVLDERSRRRWAAAESAAIGYDGDALVSSATGLARETIRKGRREIARGDTPTSRIRAPGLGRPGIEQEQPGVLAALEALVDPLTRGDPTSPLRWTCKSRVKLAATLTEPGMASELDHSGSTAPPLGLPIAVGAQNGRSARSIPTATSSSNTSMRRRTGL